MHSVLMATVLVGGLSAGDGGETGRGAVGEVGLDFRGDWEGAWQEGSSEPRWLSVSYCDPPWTPYRWLFGRLLEQVGEMELHLFNIAVERGGRVRLTLDNETTRLGIYKIEGRTVYLCFSHRPGVRPTSFRPGPDKELWVLHRPKPKKT